MTAPSKDAFLDGTPDEFPNREQAKKEYREAWQSWLGCWGDDKQMRWRKQQLETRMDELQLQICRGPGPVWREFTESLPGFREHWKNLGEQAAKL